MPHDNPMVPAEDFEMSRARIVHGDASWSGSVPQPRWTDAIGDRLDHPERVPPELQHLIPDDQARVALLLSLPITGRVLDVGCSDGTVTERLSRLPAVTSVIGIDLSIDHLTPGARQAAEFVKHDIRTPLRPWFGVFDTIVATEVFEHLTAADASKALTNLRAVLRGQMVISVPNRACADHYVAGCRDRWRWPDHRSAWTADRLRKFLAGAWLNWYQVYPSDTSDTGIWLTVTATWGGSV